MNRLEATYVLPLRWSDTRATSAMTAYLSELSRYVDVIVVDGSDPGVFTEHSRVWGGLVEHVAPDRDLSFRNGKVNGVTTGVRRAPHRKVVIADDDVRYDEASLRKVVSLLDAAELIVVPTYFDPPTFHAQWDTARLLLNRAFGVHFPASVAVDRDLFLTNGGYDGDVLFENLELIRTMRYSGARVVTPMDVCVRHLTAERSWFWGQRVRQAYDDFTMPERMTLWLSLAPIVVRNLRRPKGLVMGAAASVALAELGRRRGTGRRYYPATASLLAPLWLAERAVCAWAAAYYRLVKGGVPYRDGVIERAATPRRELRRRVSEARVDRHRAI